MKDRLRLQPYGGLNREEALKIAEKNPLSPKLFPRGLELLQGLEGFEAFYVTLRDELKWDQDPDRKTRSVVFWGPTGAGKRVAISELFYLLEHDPQVDFPLHKGYVSFAESANANTLEGRIRPVGHGRYSLREYRLNTQRMSGFLGEYRNNFEGNRLLAVEASAPTAFLTEEGIQGADRGYSAVRRLVAEDGPLVRIVAVRRDKALYKEIMSFRGKLEKATPGNIANIIEGSNLALFGNGNMEEVARMSEEDKKKLIAELKESGAPPVGVQRSAMEMRDRMLMVYDQKKIASPDDEEGFWKWLLEEDLGMDSSQYLVTLNQYSPKGVSLHEGLIVKHDLPRKHNLTLKMHLSAERDLRLNPHSRIAMRNELNRYRDWIKDGANAAIGWFSKF